MTCARSGETTLTQFVKTADGAAAKFPFALKPTFRRAFPSAKWNAVEKQWEVGARSVKRLEQWLSEVESSGIEQELAAVDQAEMSEAEVQKLAASLAQATSKLAKLRDARASVEESAARAAELRKLLESTGTEIAEAKAQLAAAQEAAAAASAENEARISHIATRAQIESLRSTMRRNWIPKAYARKPFDEAQSELLEIREALSEIGIECSAARLAAGANFNRRDRDFDSLSVAIEFVVV